MELIARSNLTRWSISRLALFPPKFSRRQPRDRRTTHQGTIVLGGHTEMLVVRFVP
jgi:hypothetical protein